MKVFVDYETTDGPWGGLNSFMRSLKEYIDKYPDRVKLHRKLKADTDIWLIGAASLAPRKPLTVEYVHKQLAKRSNPINKFLGRYQFRLVQRLDGLRSTYAGGKDPNDDVQIMVAQLADFIIFQSEASLESFRQNEYTKNNHTIVLNGADQAVFSPASKEYYRSGKLKLLSSSWSINPNKGFEAIAAFSEHPQVESYFVGRWNKDIDSKQVKVIEAKGNKQLADVYRQAHVFLHAARNDPCPNVVVEALSTELPVIYNTTGGTPELAAEFGVALPEQLSPEAIDNTVKLMIAEYPKLVERIHRHKPQFSIDTAAKAYLRAFANLLESKVV